MRARPRPASSTFPSGRWERGHSAADARALPGTRRLGRAPAPLSAPSPRGVAFGRRNPRPAPPASPTRIHFKRGRPLFCAQARTTAPPTPSRFPSARLPRMPSARSLPRRPRPRRAPRGDTWYLILAEPSDRPAPFGAQLVRSARRVQPGAPGGGRGSRELPAWRPPRRRRKASGFWRESLGASPDFYGNQEGGVEPLALPFPSPWPAPQPPSPRPPGVSGFSVNNILELQSAVSDSHLSVRGSGDRVAAERAQRSARTAAPRPRARPEVRSGRACCSRG